MKIQAKQVEIGMTIGWGVVTLTVKNIVTGNQKNGIETKKFEGSAVRSMGKGHKLSNYKNYDFTAKSETFLDLR